LDIKEPLRAEEAHCQPSRQDEADRSNRKEFARQAALRRKLTGHRWRLTMKRFYDRESPSITSSAAPRPPNPLIYGVNEDVFVGELTEAEWAEGRANAREYLSFYQDVELNRSSKAGLPNPCLRSQIFDASCIGYEKYPSLDLNDGFCAYLKERLDELTVRCTTESKAWERTVIALFAEREYKSRCLMDNPRPTALLDRLDEVEEHLCGILFGAFRFLLEDTQFPSYELFSKDDVDNEMETTFGSLETDTVKQPDEDAAMKLFSRYLSRKVWVPLPWKKLAKSKEGFFDRVVRNPLDKPADSLMIQFVERIVEAICHGMDPISDIETEYVPDGACVERSRQEGGKRFAEMFLSPVENQYVKVTPIISSGKIRVITVDSYENAKFVWINKFLGRCFRQFPFSIFGRTVEDWVKEQGEDLLCKEGEKFVSGDMECATDNFDGRPFDAGIEKLAKLYPEHISKADVVQIKSFTTHARFKYGKTFLLQTRGQLMGSAVSFPFLNIVNLASYLVTLPEQWQRRFLTCKVKIARSMLMKLKRVGFNGDDIIFPATEERVRKWEGGVHRIGGIVSRGKTLLNDTYFTVNSELWNGLHQVSAVRPSFITSITGVPKQPAKDWKEFERASTPLAREIWRLHELLRLDIPISLGGLGVLESFNSERMWDAWLRSSFENGPYNKVIFRTLGSEIDSCNKAFGPLHGPKISCWISKNAKKAYANIFNSRFGQWRASEQEIAFLWGMLMRPDLLDHRVVQVARRFADQLKSFRFRSFSDYVWMMESDDFEKSNRISWLQRHYSDLMSGLRPARLPLTLLRPFYARVHEDDMEDLLMNYQYHDEFLVHDSTRMETVPLTFGTLTRFSTPRDPSPESISNQFELTDDLIAEIQRDMALDWDEPEDAFERYR
jgi:hypothetical protein